MSAPPPSSPATALSPADDEYVLGTGDDELARLGYQHQVWSAPTAEAWERARFQRGATLLDVGCGPGYATFDLAHLVGPEGRVLAADVSARFIGHLERERTRRGMGWIEPFVQDLESLALPDATVDGAFARWVLCFVRDPAEVVARVARALRPGGPFAVMDYCQYEAFSMAPRDEAIDRVIAAVARTFRSSGGNPDVGLELPRYMHAAGLDVESVRSIVRVARPGSALWEWPATFFANYLPVLVSSGEITVEERDAFDRVWAERSASSDSYLLTPQMVEVIGVRRA